MEENRIKGRRAVRPRDPAQIPLHGDAGRASEPRDPEPH